MGKNFRETKDVKDKDLTYIASQTIQPLPLGEYCWVWMIMWFSDVDSWPSGKTDDILFVGETLRKEWFKNMTVGFNYF